MIVIIIIQRYWRQTRSIGQGSSPQDMAPRGGAAGRGEKKEKDQLTTRRRNIWRGIRWEGRGGTADNRSSCSSCSRWPIIPHWWFPATIIYYYNIPIDERVSRTFYCNINNITLSTWRDRTLDTGTAHRSSVCSNDTRLPTSFHINRKPNLTSCYGVISVTAGW